MFKHHPNSIGLRGIMAAVCLAVIAGCGGSGSSSDTGGDKTSNPAPAAGPLNLIATAGNAQVSLTWTSMSGATSYDVKRSTTQNGPWTQIAVATSPSYTDATVSNGATYYYVVTAVDAGGESPASTVATVTPDPTITTPAIPMNLAATAGNAQVSLIWTASSGATSYDVKRSVVQGGPYAQLAAATSPSYTDATVSNGATYYYVVTAADSAGESADSAEVSATPDPTVSTPAIPMGLAASAGNAQASLTWAASSGATSYHVKRATTSGGPYTQIGAPTATAYLDTTLTDGTTYYYVVSAVDSAGESANSAQVDAVPNAPTTVPAVPTGLSATPGNAQAVLSWSASSGAASYHVKRSMTSGGPYTQVSAPTGTSYTDTTLTNGTNYYYVVSAMDSAGESANSAQVKATPVAPVAIPATPTALTATAGNAQATLSWSASSGASAYHVKRATTSGGPYAQISAPTSTTYADTSVTNGTIYYYVVSAVDTAGESANSTEVSAAPTAPVTIPGAPTGLAATAGDTQVALNWAATSGATSYHVKRATTVGGPYAQIGAPTSTSYLDTGLTDGTTYYYVVSAMDTAGESANSTQVSATPVSAVSTPPAAGLPTGPTFNFTPAASLSSVTVVPNRDSVIIQVPAVANARDFRVLVQPTGVTANSDGTESVSGGTQFCAGLRQHQSRTHYIADAASKYPYYFWTNGATDSPTDENPPNFFTAPATPWVWADLDTPPTLAIEVTGVTAGMTVTVEALDRLCPFPGNIGQTHVDVALSHNVDMTHPENPWIDATSVASYPIVTKAEVIARYGSLIINGQGWAGGANVQANPPTSPPFGQPAPVNPPKVLARTAIAIAPLANPPAPPAGFFDDFSDSTDTFKTLPIPNWTYPRFTAGQLVLQNSKWTIYGNGFTCCAPTDPPDGQGVAQAYVDGGVLHTNLGDWSQDVLSEIAMFPRQAAHLNATSYLHITYEVPSFATSRRYWVVTLCGSSTPGQTLDSTGTLKEQIVHSTFFYINTGLSPSTAGWNCLQVFNREGNSYALGNWESMYNVIKGGRPPVPANNGLFDVADYIYNTVPSIADPTKIAAYTVHPESDVMVMINKPIPAANLPEVWGANEQVVQSAVTSPVNVSPMQLDSPSGEVAWFYKIDANGNPIAPILDDQQLVSPRTKYDLYVRNNRLIMYVNGQPTLCNDFTTPTTTLNIADAAVGFHQVLYHSSGEFVERFTGPDQGGAYHYRYNSPFMDQRTWDNIGFEENVSPPADFNPQTCFVHTSLGAENNEP